MGFDNGDQYRLQDHVYSTSRPIGRHVRCKLAILSLVMLAIHASVVSGQEFESKVNLFKGDPKANRGGTLTHVGSPTLTLNSGQKGSYLVGNEVVIGGKAVPVGIQVQIVTTDAGNGAIRVSLTLEYSELVGKKPAQVVSTKTQTRTTTQSGSKIHL